MPREISSNTHIDYLESRLSIANSELESLRADAQNSRQTNAKLQREHTNLKDYVRGLEQSNADLQKKNEELKQRIMVMYKEQRTAEEKRASPITDADSYGWQAQFSSAKATRAEQDCRELVELVQQQQAQIEQLQASMNQQVEKIREGEDRLQELRDEVQALSENTKELARLEVIAGEVNEKIAARKAAKSRKVTHI